MTFKFGLKVLLARREEHEEVAVESVYGLGAEMASLFMPMLHWLELSHMDLQGRLGNVVELVPKKKVNTDFSEQLAVSCCKFFMEVSEIFCILDLFYAINPVDSLVKLMDSFSECLKMCKIIALVRYLSWLQRPAIC